MAESPQIPRRFVTSQFTGQNYRDGRDGSAYRMLARGLAELGEGIGAVGKVVENYQNERGQEDGANAVTRDPDTGELSVQRRSNITQYGQSYNRAAKMAYVARLEPEAKSKLAELARDNPDPEAFASVANAFVTELATGAAEIDPVLQGPVMAFGEQELNRFYEGLVERKHRSDIANSHDALVNSANAKLEDAKLLAKQGGTKTEDFTEIWTSYGDLVEELGQNPEFAGLGKNPAWAEKQLKDGIEATNDAALDGLVDQVKNTRAPEDALRAVETILDEAGYSEPKRAEKRLEWRAKVLEAAAGRLVLDGKDQEAFGLIQLAPENFVSGASGVADKIVAVESGGDPKARPRDPATGRLLSTATGLGQFTEDTWIETITKHRPDLVEGKTRAQVLMMREEPEISREMVEAHAQDNAVALNAAGFESTPGNVYLAHFAGKTGAVALLKASPDTPVSDVLSAGAIKANKSVLQGKTAGEVVAWAGRKVGDTGGLSSNGVAFTASVRKLIAQRDALSKELKQEVSEVGKLALKGFAPPEESLTDLRARVSGSGNNELAAQLSAIERLHAFNKVIKTAPPAALEQWTRTERARLGTGATPQEVDRLNAAEATLTKMRSELANDPLSWASGAGLVEVSELDFDNATVMAKRKSDAGRVAEHYGIEPKYLTRTERDDLTTKFKTGSPAERLALAHSIATGFGEDAPRAIGEISKDSPAAAHLTRLLSLSDDYLPTSRDGFKGLEGANATKAQTRIADTEIGTAIDARLPGVRKEITQAANAIYAGRATDRGIAEFDEDLYREAVQEAAGQHEVGGALKGGIGSYNGRDVLLPPHLSSSDLAESVRTLSNADLMRLSAGGGAPMYRTPAGRMKLVNPADLGDAYLVTVGMGLYQVSISDPSSGAPTFILDAATGEPYALDLSGRAP